MNTLLTQATSRELEAEQLRRCIARTDAELLRLTTQLHDMIAKQARRRAELERQSLNSQPTTLN